MMKVKSFILLTLSLILWGTASQTAYAQSYTLKEVTDVANIKEGVDYILFMSKGKATSSSLYYYGCTYMLNATSYRVEQKSVSVESIAGNYGNSSYDKYFFSFVQNDGKWYLKSKSLGKYLKYAGYGYQTTDNISQAGEVTFSQTAYGYRIKLGTYYIEQQSGSWAVSLDASTSLSSTHFKLYAMELAGAEASFHYYNDGVLLNPKAEKAEIDGKKTVAELSKVPSYLEATYYSDEDMTIIVDPASVAEASDYYVATEYPADFFLKTDGSFFALTDGNYMLFSKDLSGIERYALTAEGDWYNGFAILDAQYYGLSNQNQQFTEGNNDKWTVNYTDGKYYLGYAGQFLSLGQYNALLTVTGSALQNGDDIAVADALNSYPEAHYVGSYYQGQTDVTLDELVTKSGDNVVEFNPNAYYVIESQDGNSFLSTLGSTQNLYTNEISYAWGAANQETCAALWKWNSFTGGLKSVNLDLLMDEDGSFYGSAAEVSFVQLNNNMIPSFGLALGETGNYLGYEGLQPSPAEWRVREVSTITVPLNLAEDGKSYATLYAPVALTLTDVTDAKAYLAEAIADNEMPLIEATSIADYTPMVLVSETGADKAVFTIAAEGEVAPNGSSLFGSVFTLEFGEASHDHFRTLGRNEQGAVGFFTPSDDVVSIPANRARLAVGVAATQGFLLRFPDGTTTSIDRLAGNGAANAPIYDLSGRRVNQPVRGNIYIQGGKKFMCR